MKNLSLLAVAVSLALTGCGGSDSSGGSSSGGDTTTPSTTTSTNTFVDAAVNGLYYTDNNDNNGFTANGGQYTAANDDTVTFYIGGENGIKIGAASNRDYLSPFEAAGTYERALNLAILLQTVDTDSSESTIQLPETLTTNIDTATLSALNKVNLDDIDTITTFLTSSMGYSSSDITSEAEAIAHMRTTLSGINRGSDSSVPMFERNGTIIREISVAQYQLHEWFDGISSTNEKQYYVHADKTTTQATFDLVRGSSRMDYRLETDNVVLLAGNNDNSFGSDYAAQFLTCIEATDDASKFSYDEAGNGANNQCNGVGATIDSQFDLSGTPFLYKFSNPNKAETTDETLSYTSDDVTTYMTHVTATSQAALNSMVESDLYDDSDAQDASEMQYNIYSQSYDAVTGVLTKHDKKFSLGSGTAKTDPSDRSSGGVTESITFMYEIENQNTDRYVDFVGTWELTETCTDGQVATAQLVFDSQGLVMTGQECESGTPTTISESLDYEGLAGMDYWWFNQNGRESKATLTELNTTVRFCDQDNYNMGVDSCNAGNEFFVKWSYQPAGSDWDEGILVRRKMNPDGTTANVSTMQKI